MKHLAKFITGFLLITALIANSSSKANAFRNNNDSKVEWKQYIYEDWGLSIEVPQEWEITPPDTKGIGAILSVSSNSPTSLSTESMVSTQDSHISTSPKIEIGAYLTAASDDLSLKDWSIQYDRVHSVLDEESKNDDTSYIQVEQSEQESIVIAERIIDNNIIQYANIIRGEIVWFVWSTGVDKSTFEHVVSSLEFGKHTPLSIEEMYGFEPFNLNDMILAHDNTENGVIAPSIASSWRVPLSGTANCKSSAHNPVRSLFSVDVAKPAWTSISSANHGEVISAGWDTSGYGNLARINYGGYKVYYAHLIAFSSNVLSYSWISKDRRVGWVGNTGASGGNHLHFELRNQSNNSGASLVGMTGFSTGGHIYPYPGDAVTGTCGSLTR